jgi:tRNA modification GTPase
VDLESTILAVATPPGQSARGMIRIAGPNAAGLANSILESPLPDIAGVFSVRTFPELFSFPALAILFTADRGPLGQPVVELWLPGNSELLHRALNQLLEGSAEYGARLASPGEFTARAWMLGRMDLTQAEGVGLLVSAEHTAAVRAAHRLLAGGPGERIKELREHILDLLAALEAGIDFSDQEDVRFLPTEEVQSTLSEILKALRLLRERGVPLERFQGPPRIMVVGPPNAGKSTLCNALLSGDRFLTASIEGTTRDLVATPWVFDAPGGALDAVLVDSPGVFDEKHGVDLGSVRLSEQASQQHHEALSSANVILSCQVYGEKSVAWTEDPRVIRVHTKMDEPDREQPSDCFNVGVSAHTGYGINQLRAQILDKLMGFEEQKTDGVALRESHWSTIDQAIRSLCDARELARQEICPDELVCEALLLARRALDEVLGNRDPEAVFDRVFSSFCIGK